MIGRRYVESFCVLCFPCLLLLVHSSSVVCSVRSTASMFCLFYCLSHIVCLFDWRADSSLFIYSFQFIFLSFGRLSHSKKINVCDFAPITFSQWLIWSMVWTRINFDTAVHLESVNLFGNRSTFQDVCLEIAWSFRHIFGDGKFLSMIVIEIELDRTAIAVHSLAFN